MKKINHYITGLSIIILLVFCVVFIAESDTALQEGYVGLVPSNPSKVGIEVDLGISHDFICEESNSLILSDVSEEVISSSKDSDNPGPFLVGMQCHKCHVSPQSYVPYKTLKVPWQDSQKV